MIKQLILTAATIMTASVVLADPGPQWLNCTDYSSNKNLSDTMQIFYSNKNHVYRHPLAPTKDQGKSLAYILLAGKNIPEMSVQFSLKRSVRGSMRYYDPNQRYKVTKVEPRYRHSTGWGFKIYTEALNFNLEFGETTSVRYVAKRDGTVISSNNTIYCLDSEWSGEFPN